MMIRRLLELCFIFVLQVMPLSSAWGVDLPGIADFITEMVNKHQFKRDELVQLFNEAEHRQDIIDVMDAPSTRKPWLEYRASFINPKRITGGVKFWLKHTDTLARAEKKYGVPQEIIVAIIGVETLYGRNSGTYRTLDALTTLTFDYPRRVDFFRSELEQYLLLAREQNFDLLKMRASYAGAMGIPQFMPSSYRKNAVDFNGDGKIDLLKDEEDAIGSVANYLSDYGWKSGEAVAAKAIVEDQAKIGDVKTARSFASWATLGVSHQRKLDGELQAYLIDFTLPDGREFWFGLNNFAVITSYNNSTYYAMSVYQLALELRTAGQAQGIIRLAPL
jgi:membrane-bound lytic murein transglycosylase B